MSISLLMEMTLVVFLPCATTTFVYFLFIHDSYTRVFSSLKITLSHDVFQMATASKAANSQGIHPEERFASLNPMNEALQLSPVVEGRVEPYELVELFYGSSTVSPANHTSHLSPRSAGTSSPEVMQVIKMSK
ncbi:hypothetical protein C7M84_024507 [Penaeus vannamei]|uniref:Uncharacterized protein n=1 Tax=Penaeus vannamei TaxID=6689 RepID=A0A423U0V1_PENVA|nr:hypothetical protein C7M84_024507 [Penaeus vannamei]